MLGEFFYSLNASVERRATVRETLTPYLDRARSNALLDVQPAQLEAPFRVLH
jgi:hypothetical protein